MRLFCLSLVLSVQAVPNILLLTTDQQRVDTVGCYGNEHAISPNLDRLALEGVRFTQAHAASPVCMPCRTSLLTGVHVPVHGIVENGIDNHKFSFSGNGGGGGGELTVYPDLLLKAGYFPALVGKTNFSPLPSSFLFMEEHNWNTYRRCSQNQYEKGTCYYSEDEFLETYLVNRSLEVIDNITRDYPDRPWFLHLSFLSPHPPATPPAPWDKVYEGSDLPSLNYLRGDIDELPTQTKELLALMGDHPETDSRASEWLLPDGSPNMTFIDSYRKLYYGLAAYVDHEVGRMMDGLEERGLTDSTLFIFTSDHGSMLFDHGIDDEKHSFLDESWRVPLIMRYPGHLPANITRSFAIIGPDITATILGVAGALYLPTSGHVPNATAAANTSFYMSGFDLATPLLLDAKAPSARSAAVAVEFRGFAVATKEWKLSYFPVEGQGRFFDRIHDAAERQNLWDVTEVRGTRDAILMALLRWRTRQDDLQYQAVRWSGGGEVGVRAQNATFFLEGIAAEVDLQNDLAHIAAVTS